MRTIIEMVKQLLLNIKIRRIERELREMRFEEQWDKVYPEGRESNGT